MKPAAALALLALAGCAQPQGVPADYDSLPSTSRVAPLKADFNLADELGLAAAACVASELKGPAALNSLRDRGYTASREFGVVKYVKISPRAEPGLLTGGLRAVIVSDNGAPDCRIEVPRGTGYTSMSLVSSALEKLGYQRAGGKDSAPRFARDGVVFMVSGRQSRYEVLPSIYVRRLKSE
jgi:hypothetical protein